MFSREDILKQLRDGADPQTIATAMAEAINGAIGDYEKEKAEAEAQAKIAAGTKRRDARALVDAMADFFGKYFEGEEMDEDDREKATDAIIELTDHMIELEHNLSAIADKYAPKAKADRAPSAEDEIDEDTIRRFLSML